MVIEFNPRITKKFVSIILKDIEKPFALNDDEAIEFAHKVIIGAFTKYKININDIINFLKDEKL